MPAHQYTVRHPDACTHTCIVLYIPIDWTTSSLVYPSLTDCWRTDDWLMIGVADDLDTGLISSRCICILTMRAAGPKTQPFRCDFAHHKYDRRKRTHLGRPHQMARRSVGVGFGLKDAVKSVAGHEGSQLWRDLLEPAAPQVPAPENMFVIQIQQFCPLSGPIVDISLSLYIYILG